jgi:hypothetical protein
MAKKYQLHGAFPSKAGDSAYQVAQKNGFEGTEQEWLGSLVGPQGNTGSAGPSGIHVGSEPPTDPTVHVWINPDSDDEINELPSGPAGEDGGYYTPAVTQTETGKAEFSWTASREDMPTVAPQSVTLPAGPKGETGETGPQGNPGADGKSAYQYAQDGGYTGTEGEFAAKLAADLSDVDAVGTTKVLEIELTQAVDQITQALTQEQADKIRNARFLFMDVDVTSAPEDTASAGDGTYTIYIGSGAYRLYLAQDINGIPGHDWGSEYHAQFVFVPRWDFDSNTPRYDRKAMMFMSKYISNAGTGVIKATTMDLAWSSDAVVAGEPLIVEATQMMGPGTKITISV